MLFLFCIAKIPHRVCIISLNCTIFQVRNLLANLVLPFFSIHSPSTEFYQSSSEIVLESDHSYPPTPHAPANPFPFINYLHLFGHFLVYIAKVSYSNILSTM